jgi:uncharacterized protein (DUF305 family)
LFEPRRVVAWIVGAVVVAAACSLAGCGDDAERAATGPTIVQPGAPGEDSHTLSEDELGALEEPRFTGADVEFMQGMIHHHAQALRMTALVPKRAVGDELPLLAERMDISQTSEIDQMKRWLRQRKQTVPAIGRMGEHVHQPGMELMPGMLTEPELVRLEGAEGRAFERLFLRDMIRHHTGAITMVRRLYASGGGLEPEADAFARHVEADQQIEIERMRGLLAQRT